MTTNLRRSSVLDRLCGGLALAMLLAPPLWSQSRAPNSPQTRRMVRFLQGRSQADRTSAQALGRARVTHQAMAALPRAANLTAAWTAVGPGQIATAAFGDVTGRVTTIVVDPADTTGNTVYVGTTGGGVWKSTNAAGQAASVTFTALTDDLAVFSPNAGTSAMPSLSVGAMALGNGVLLAGTGDPNDATDSYYGTGLLRSVDGGLTWSLIQQSQDGVAGNHTFFGLAFAGIAFSTATPALVVAAVSQAAGGALENAVPATYSTMGLYYSADAGVTWQLASVLDGNQPVQTAYETDGGNAATAVVWNPVRQMFYAAIRDHGYYQSADGMNWTRMANQPGTGLTLAACPTNPGLAANPNCPLFRGTLAVQATTGDTFALSVDGNNLDQGLWQDVCGLSGSGCASGTVTWGNRIASAALEVGSGSTQIPQADYDFTLAATANGPGTLLYVGTVDLYRCSLAAGAGATCVLRNTTNAENGCAAPAEVSPAEHAIATDGATLVYLGNDGGLWRSTDGVDEMGTPCAATDASHFENLNAGLGSLTEVVSFAEHPSNTGTLLVGAGANGTAGTGTSTTSAWPQLATGEGGMVAIDQTNPQNWYLSTDAGVSIARCALGSGCTAGNFAGIATLSEAQVDDDIAAIDAPWLLDPQLDTEVLIGTCRVWRGLAATAMGWPGANNISEPFGSTNAAACGAASPIVRSLGVGGPVSSATAVENAGSSVLYAGLAGTLDGGNGFGGMIFATMAGATASGATAWSDVGLSLVSNDTADQGVFNPGGFDVSSVTADPHDATGATVYATVMGFGYPHVYRSTNFGAAWTNISSNLPNAPANSLLVDPNDANTVYVAMDTGVYATTAIASCASGNCWSVYGTALPNSPVIQLQAAAAMASGDGRLGELRAGTYGRGIWEIPLLTAINPAAPALALSPTTLTFAIQQVGTASAAQTVTVSNTGNAAMTVSSVATTGDFTVSGTCVGSPVAPNASCTEAVVFLPSATGTRSGVLTVYANVPGGQGTVALTGTGAPPAAIVLNPLTLTFGATAIGATSAVQNVTVSNTGGVAAALQGATITGDFAISADSCGSSLAAGTGCTLSIGFTPTASGTRTGMLTLVDSVGTQTVSLSGTGDAPATDALAPLSLTFAAQALNSASATQNVTLTNSGDAALTTISAQITSGDFTVTNNCGTSLNGHAACAISVAFVPKSVGAQTGVLVVSDEFRSQTVTLIGSGLAPAGVSISPTGSMLFAATAVASTSASQTVTLTNNGGSPLLFQGAAVTGDFVVVAGTSTCGSAVAVGAACTFDVAFAPTVGGTRTGTLSVTDSAASSPQKLVLLGLGIDFTLAPNGPTSATIAAGASTAYSLLLSSAAGVTGTVAFTCSGLPVNTTCNVSPSAPALGGTTVITVTIATSVAGLEQPGLPFPRRMLWFAGLLPLGLLALRRRRRLLMVILLAGMVGCGAGRVLPANGLPGTGNATPAGTSTIVVAGSSAGLVRSVNLTLVVQ